MTIISRGCGISAHIAALALAAAAAAGCGLDKQEAPGLTGPSEFALSLRLTATPDVLPRDSRTQSLVTVEARDAEGRPLAGQRLSVALRPDPATGVPAGAAVTQSEVVTDASGRATFGVLAPSPSSVGNSIVVQVTPVGTNADNATPRQLTIALTPANSSGPTPSFTFDPPTPEIGQAVRFDASATTDEAAPGQPGMPCNDACTYAWNFGGEGTATGRIVTRAFQAAGSYEVALTVTDASGLTATARQTVTVSAVVPPSVSFTVNPASPLVGQNAQFTATATASTNHRIVRYDWAWGDGTGNTVTTANIAQHTFGNPGRFFVTVTVTDDTGQTSSASNTVIVRSGLTPSFTFSPAAPRVGQAVTFDGSASTSDTGTSITDYAWSFGDGTESNSSSPTVQKTYGTAATYTVRLTITDSAGRKESTTRTVTVAP